MPVVVFVSICKRFSDAIDAHILASCFESGNPIASPLLLFNLRYSGSTMPDVFSHLARQFLNRWRDSSDN